MPARVALATLSTNQIGLQEKQIKRLQNPMKKIQGSPKVFKAASLKGASKVNGKLPLIPGGKENRVAKLLRKPGNSKRIVKNIESAPAAESCDLPVDLHCPVAATRLPDDVKDIDEDDLDNPQLCAEYAVDIYNYLHEVESRAELEIRDNFLAGCPVTGKMRAVLVDWLVEVQQQFKLLQETFFLTLDIVDRYLNCEGRHVHKSQLQLVGVSAMFLASKIEEIYAPEISDFVYITDDTYTADEIRCTELRILNVLDFKLNKPSSLVFLRRFSKAGDVDILQHNLAKYVLELALVEYPLVSLRPSLLAASALQLSLLILNPNSSPETLWSSTLSYHSKYSSAQLSSTTSKMAGMVVNVPSGKLQAVTAKYSSPKLMKVSQLPQLTGDILRRLSKC